jgi:hypothetical protein
MPIIAPFYFFLCRPYGPYTELYIGALQSSWSFVRLPELYRALADLPALEDLALSHAKEVAPPDMCRLSALTHLTSLWLSVRRVPSGLHLSGMPLDSLTLATRTFQPLEVRTEL